VLLLSGIVLGSLLIRSAITLPTAGAAELRASRLAAIFGGVHHAAALAWWATASVAHDDLDWLPAIAVPCALGVLVALLQWRASGHVAHALAEAEHG
jgi:drug/metabolite transporter superfamily protein YnfA